MTDIHYKPRGPKKGERHSGQFVAGGSANNRAMTKEHKDFRRDVRKLCQGYTAEVVDFLVSTMQDSKMQPKVRLESAKEILNRGYGKAAIVADVTITSSGDLTAFSDQQLIDLIEKQEAEKGQLIEHGDIT